MVGIREFLHDIILLLQSKCHEAIKRSVYLFLTLSVAVFKGTGQAFRCFHIVDVQKDFVDKERDEIGKRRIWSLETLSSETSKC